MVISNKFDNLDIKECFLEQNELRLELDPYEYVEIQERHETVRHSFNSLADDLKKIIYTHLLNDESFINIALKCDVELQDVSDIYDYALNLFKETYLENYLGN